MSEFPFIPFIPTVFSSEECIARSAAFYSEMNKRRTVRDIADTPLPQGVLESIIATAGTAPSGAHKQPWTFCVVTNKELKSEIRKAAEQEEKANYHQRMSEEWLRDLAPLGTDEHKEFLETAPALIVVFKRIYEIENNGHKHNNYYVQESVGIACGLLIAAIHHAGLVCLTHTPSPMNFLERILNRPQNERAFLLIPIGYPAKNATVPDITRKNLEEVMVRYL
jgi:iodotyrosine deiodinase